MPVTAARLADVGAGDAQPLVLGRGRQHLLEQRAVARLQVVLPLQGLPCRGDAIGERVANPLQVLEAAYARHGRAGRDLCVEGDARKRLGGEIRQLVLEPADLTAQLSAREALVASHSKRREHVSIEQIRHKTQIECRSRRFGRSLAACYASIAAQAIQSASSTAA